MKLLTSTGQKLDCDSCLIDKARGKLYLHLRKLDLDSATSIFNNPEELPLQKYPSFTVVEFIGAGSVGGVNVRLKEERR